MTNIKPLLENILSLIHTNTSQGARNLDRACSRLLNIIRANIGHLDAEELYALHYLMDLLKSVSMDSRVYLRNQMTGISGVENPLITNSKIKFYQSKMELSEVIMDILGEMENNYYDQLQRAGFTFDFGNHR